MTGKRQEIRAHGLHVGGQVGDGLRGIDQHQRARRFCRAGHYLHRIDRAKRVGNPCESEDFHPSAEQRVEGLLIESAIVVAGNHLEGGSGSLAEHLPRDDVRMMFQGGNEHFVARPDAAREGEDVGHQIDAGGGAGSEDHLVAGCRVQVLRHRFARVFKRLGGGAGQLVGAAVDVGIDRLIIMA